MSTNSHNAICYYINARNLCYCNYQHTCSYTYKLTKRHKHTCTYKLPHTRLLRLIKPNNYTISPINDIHRKSLDSRIIFMTVMIIEFIVVYWSIVTFISEDLLFSIMSPYKVCEFWHSSWYNNMMMKYVSNQKHGQIHTHLLNGYSNSTNSYLLLWFYIVVIPFFILPQGFNWDKHTIKCTV